MLGSVFILCVVSAPVPVPRQHQIGPGVYALNWAWNDYELTLAPDGSYRAVQYGVIWSGSYSWDPATRRLVLCEIYATGHGIYAARLNGSLEGYTDSGSVMRLRRVHKTPER